MKFFLSILAFAVCASEPTDAADRSEPNKEEPTLLIAKAVSEESDEETGIVVEFKIFASYRASDVEKVDPATILDAEPLFKTSGTRVISRIEYGESWAATVEGKRSPQYMRRINDNIFEFVVSDPIPHKRVISIASSKITPSGAILLEDVEVDIQDVGYRRLIKGVKLPVGEPQVSNERIKFTASLLDGEAMIRRLKVATQKGVDHEGEDGHFWVVFRASVKPLSADL